MPEVQNLDALTDGCVIYCDAAPNVRVWIGKFGKKMTDKLPGARIGLKSGAFEAVHFNSRCKLGDGGYDNVGGECFAVLKAIEAAIEAKLERVTIRNDWVQGFNSLPHGGGATSGAKYLAVARRLAAEANLAVTFDRCTSAENQADRLSRGPRSIHNGKVVY